MHIDTTIFKAYDVRGLFPDEINEDAVRSIGRGLVAQLDAKRLGVSRDMRVSSPALADAFIDGVRAQGADVIDYGLGGTDMLYFGVARDGLDGGAQITASHNPGVYNGIKMVGAGANPLSNIAGIEQIRDMILTDTLPSPAATRGNVTKCNLLDDYINLVLSFINIENIKPLTVVLDAGNGMAGLIAPPLFDRLPCQVTKLCFELDGRFPNHEANPLIEKNRRHLTKEVLRQQADIGIAWDGDADRCFFIDGDGSFIPGDFITALLAEIFLDRQPGASIVYDLRASHVVRDTVERHGGRALINRVGHTFIKRRMRAQNAIFGGEVTGHYYFRDFYYADNGFIPALLILELLSKHNCSLRDLVTPFRNHYFISGEINTRLTNLADVPPVLAGIASRYGDGQLSRMDGISVDYPTWHFNVRSSNTEPMIRLNLEAVTQETMEEKRDEVIALIRELEGR
jgi:phosphomannomutase